MLCPVCAADERDLMDRCPRCGAPLQPAVWPAWHGAVIEGSARRGPVHVMPLMSAGADAAAPSPDTLTGSSLTHSAARTSLVVRRTALPALLWQQRPVRAVAAVSAGAIALTLGARVLRGWLTRAPDTQALAASALPTVADLLRQAEFPARLVRADGKRVERAAETIETIVCVQRVVRRR